MSDFFRLTRIRTVQVYTGVFIDIGSEYRCWRGLFTVCSDRDMCKIACVE